MAAGGSVPNFVAALWVLWAILVVTFIEGLGAVQDSEITHPTEGDDKLLDLEEEYLYVCIS